MDFLLANVSLETKIDWFMLWKSVGWFDVVCVVIVAIGLVVGMRRGLAKMTPRFVGFLGAVTIAQEYYGSFSQFIHNRFPVPILPLETIIFSGLAIGCILLVEFASQILSLVGTIEYKPLFKNVGGSLVGGICSVLLVGLLSTVVMFFPVPKAKAILESESLSGPSLIKLIPRVHKTLQVLIPSDWRATSQNIETAAEAE